MSAKIDSPAVSGALPEAAQVVIVGGGVVGCSVAYHLTKLGITDVVLLERRTLTCGTTWHAAGLVPSLRATYTLSMLAHYSTQLYGDLERETGQATGFVRNGSLTVATTAERLRELKRGASLAKVAGFECRLVTPEQIKALWPLLNVDDVIGGIYLPEDGVVSPVDGKVSQCDMLAIYDVNEEGKITAMSANWDFDGLMAQTAELNQA